MNLDSSTSVAALRSVVAQFVAEREWQKFHDAKNLAMAIAVEAAELMEHFQWLRSEELGAALQDPQHRAAVGEELADVLCFCLAMANALDFDVSTLVSDKMCKNALKYPASENRGKYVKPRRG